MPSLSSTLAIGLLATLATPAAADEVNVWIGDFDQAVEIAKRDGKDLFVDFTGSDWCKWCIQLHNEVFDHEQFLVAAQKDYVLVALDYPNSEEAKAKVPNPKRNEELSKKYQISGFPTVLLMTAEGDVFGRTGYQAGGPEAYVEHMAALRKSGRAALAEAAEGEQRLVVLDRVLAKLDELGADSAVAGRLVPSAKAAFVIDAQDEKGLLTRTVKLLLMTGRADDEVLAAGRRLDPKNEQGLLEQVVEAQCKSVDSLEAVEADVQAVLALDKLGPMKDKELAERMYVNSAVWCSRYLEDPANAKLLANKALALEPEDPELVAVLLEIVGVEDHEEIEEEHDEDGDHDGEGEGENGGR